MFNAAADHEKLHKNICNSTYVIDRYNIHEQLEFSWSRVSFIFQIIVCFSLFATLCFLHFTK